MSATNSLAAGSSKISPPAARMFAMFLRHPEWLAWFLSLFVWALLLINIFPASREAGNSSPMIYCMPVGGHLTHEIQGIAKYEPFAARILTTISKGLMPWIIMVVAMMFPLLNEPIRHVAFSVRRKDRNIVVWGFLAGYAITWTIAGMLFLLLPLFLDRLIGNQTHFVTGLIKASGFLLAGALIWQPDRVVRMTKCNQTMPIRIEGWQRYSDSLLYGLKMGIACLNMCWAPMAALMLAHHNIILMGVVTVVIICERYLLPHTSKFQGYAWGLIALTLFGMEMLA